MRVHRLVIRAYPKPMHPTLHEWQKATIVLFISDTDPYSAEQKALAELDSRCWIPESFDLRDTLIRDAVRQHGGEVWDAYLEAEHSGLYWEAHLDSLPMCKKGDSLWGTGPKLSETFVDNLIVDSGGHRLTYEEAGGYKDKNADYILGHYVLELKQFEKEGLRSPTRQEKVAKLFKRYSPADPVHQIDPHKLCESGYQRYLDIVGVPIQKRVKEASKQVKATINRLGSDRYHGGVILLNTGYLSIPHNLFVEMAERYASKDTSTISKVIVISSWTITNGFDNVVNYEFHPRETECSDLSRLKDTFFAAVTNLMTNMLRGDPGTDFDTQEPMSPTFFDHEGEKFIVGIPEIESSFDSQKG
jgi:hypothetical protein